MKKTWAFVIVSLLGAGLARAEEQKAYYFQEIWQQILSHSSAIKSQEQLEQRSILVEERARRHWLPRAYLGLKTFRTNDPSTNFVGLLQQRDLNSTDFNPSNINEPGYGFFTQSAVGIDWALYEGGMKSAMANLATSQKRAQTLEKQEILAQQYAHAARLYGQLLTASEYHKKVEVLEASVESLLNRYRIGVKSNPVGYSGLLGMKSFLNRTALEKSAAHAQSLAAKEGLVAMGFQSQNWRPHESDIFELYRNSLAVKSFGKSETLQKYMELEKAADAQVEMAQAMYFPKVGLFAEAQRFAGSRQGGNSYFVGAYLQWSLFDPSHFGARQEAQLQAASSRYQVDALQKLQTGEFQALGLMETALTETLTGIDKTILILDEQIQLMQGLFKDGVVTALQLTEVLSRKLDLLVERRETQSRLLSVAIDKLNKTQTQTKIESLTQK